MIQEHEYPVTLRWTGETRIRGWSPEDRLPELIMGTPPEFGGEPYRWSPEHLFVASVASCFITTLLAVAGASKLEIRSLEVPAFGTLERGEDRLYSMTHIVLRPVLTLVREHDREKAERLIAKTEQICLISRSVRSKVSVRPTIDIDTTGEAEAA